MSIKITNFLGRELDLPEDRLYWTDEGLWVKELEDGCLAIGLTEPTILMAGGLTEVEPLVEDGATITAGQTVCFLITAKIKYLASPLDGVIRFVQGQPDPAGPYESPLFFIEATGRDCGRLMDAAAYRQTLSDSDGARNPQGLKGGVSPTCKAVYMGIREQKLE